jgi:translation initiation factor IF-3
LTEKSRDFTGKNIRMISTDGEQEGIIKFEDGLAKGKEVGLDLVLVAEKANPPVCRLMDYGKLRFEQKKKLKDQKKNQHAQKLKEVKFRVNIEKHDYDYKVNHAIEFLGKGYKVKVTLMFRGREMAHKEFGFELIKRVIEDLKEYGVADNDAKLLGRNITANLTPVKGSKGSRH